MSEHFKDNDEWNIRYPNKPHENFEVMYKHDRLPILLRIDNIDNFDGQYYKVVLQATGDHDRHPHEGLFKSPILDEVEAAELLCESIAQHPMRYARTFFKQGKVKK